MQANFDARAGAAGSLTAPIERKQPEARKDRWMLELERAALAEQAASRAPSAASNVGGPAGAPAAAIGHHATAGATAARQGMRNAQDSGHDSRAQQGHDAQSKTVRRAAGTHGAAGPAQQMVAGAHWTGTASGDQAAVPVAAWGTAPTAGGATPAPDVAQAIAPPLSAAPAAGWQLAFAAGMAPSTGTAADAAGGEDVHAADGPVPNLVPEGEEYARSLLHVLPAEDGVHAWLRDASLSSEQVQRVASAIAGELALAGTPLAALTVNGRRILSSGAADDQPGRRTAGHPGEAPAAPSTPFAFKGA